MKQEGNKKIFIIIIACAIVTSFQLFSILEKKTITDDEGISYIAATGHQSEYDTNRPKGRWIEAGEWKKLWTPDEKFCFRTIGRDIAELDIHPPLYFWFLHVWLLAFGTSTIAGPLLNLMLFSVVFCMVVITGMKFLDSFRLAICSAIVWGVSPSVLEYVKEARQYTLLALFTIIMLYLVLTLIQSKKPKWYLYPLIAFVSACGMLTHYYFSLVIMAAFIALWFAGKAADQWKKILYLTLAEIGASILFISLHPLFLASFQRQQQQAQTFFIVDIFNRAKTTITAFTSFSFPGDFTKAGFILLIIIAVFLIIKLFRKKYPLEYCRKKLSLEQKPILIFFIFIIIGISALYIGFISPEHAMKSKYLSIAHIFIAYVIFILVGFFQLKVQNIMIGCLIVWQLTMGFFFIRSENIRYIKSDISFALEASPDKILLDNEERGIVPTVLWYFNDTTIVFAANQEYLIKNSNNWIDSLNSKTLYISDLGYGNSFEKRQQITDLILSHGYLIKESQSVRFNNTHLVSNILNKPAANM